MDEITGPILAITLVLSSVFLPSAFLGGITGQFFRQFALTISASMIISAINAMTMTPARAASIFREPQAGRARRPRAREALPWWCFALLGGWPLAVACGESLLRRSVGLNADGERCWRMHQATYAAPLRGASASRCSCPAR